MLVVEDLFISSLFFKYISNKYYQIIKCGNFYTIKLIFGNGKHLSNTLILDHIR